MMKNVWQFARYERRKNCKKKIQGLKILKIYKKPQSFMDKGKHLPPLTRENDRNITAWMATKCEGELWGNLWLQPNIKRKINWFKTVMCVCGFSIHKNDSTFSQSHQYNPNIFHFHKLKSNIHAAYAFCGNSSSFFFLRLSFSMLPPYCNLSSATMIYLLHIRV